MLSQASQTVVAENYLKQDRPFIVKDAMSSWDAMKTLSIDLLYQVGNVAVMVDDFKLTCYSAVELMSRSVIKRSNKNLITQVRITPCNILLHIHVHVCCNVFMMFCFVISTHYTHDFTSWYAQGWSSCQNTVFLPVYFIRVDLSARGGYCYVAVAVVFD